MNDANIPKPITSAARLVVHTGRRRIIRMSTSGASLRDSDPDPGREDDRRDREQAERAGRQPPPRRPLADGHEEGHQPSGEQHGAERIDPPGRADRRLGHVGDDAGGRDEDGDERQPEEPVVGEVLHDRARQHDPEPAADAQDGRDQGDAVRDAVARELVADDREREREHRPAGALDDAGRDHDADRRRERRERRAGGEDQEDDDHRALLPEHVAEPPGDRRAHGCAQEVGRQDPRRAGRRRVQVVLDRRGAPGRPATGGARTRPRRRRAA